MSFPMYRKYVNDKSYFKLISDKQFEEIQIIRKTAELFLITANQYPEKLRIMEMKEASNHWCEIDASEYHFIKEKYLTK